MNAPSSNFTTDGAGTSVQHLGDLMARTAIKSPVHNKSPFGRLELLVMTSRGTLRLGHEDTSFLIRR